MPDPNNIVIHKHRLVFMLIPKVANTSIKMAILNAFDIHHKEPKALNHYMATCRSNGSVFSLESKQQIAQYGDYLKIAFVRNPFDRIISCYKNKVLQTHHRSFEKFGINHGDSLDRFIDIISNIDDSKAEQHFRSQHEELFINGYCIPDYIGSFENINVGWKVTQFIVEEHCGLKLPDIPHVNQTDNMEIDVPLYLCEKIKQRYANDFEAFAYD